MTTPQAKYSNPHEHSFTVILVNAEDNPLAVIDDATFKGNWHWRKAPLGWNLGDPLPADPANTDAIIVFAMKHREAEVGDLCRGVRQDPTLKAIPLLVAVDQYQMPLANEMREIPNTDFVLVPIEEASLARHLNQALETRDEGP